MLVRLIFLALLVFAEEAKVVHLLVTVQDKKGQVVASSFTQGDFEVQEEGRVQKIRSFAAGASLPLTLGVLIDTSVGQRRVLGEELRGAYKLMDSAMGPNDQGFTMQFNTEVELLQDVTKSREKLEKSLGGLEKPLKLQRKTAESSVPHLGGGTTLYDALLLASNEVMRDLEGRKAIVILSDGVDNGSKVDLTAAIAAVQKSDVVVYTILNSDDQGNEGKKVLQEIAAETGGGFFAVVKKQTLEQGFGRILEGLKNQYSLTFTPDRPAYSGTFRRVGVSVPGQKNLVVASRDGYFAK
jgi:VWFA-related protein